jgi:tetratricopeptide (TPR) repeat protein
MERKQLGLYQIERLLGRGGMGSVYLAHDPRLSRSVALKVLSVDLAREPGFKERFLAEARACSRLNHPSITTIHEIGEADGVRFIAFEHVEGETLESLIARTGPLALPVIRRLAGGVADALSHAHERGIIHRDLKPGNVMVTTSGVPKILDFGLAKRLPDFVGPESDTLARLTQAGMIVGTIAYMSPEQALGHPVDSQADVFAFGSLLYEMLTGKRAFTGATPTQVLDRLLNAAPTPLRQLRPDSPEDLVRVVDRCLEKSPDQRSATIAAAFRSMDAGEAPQAPDRRSKRTRWLMAAAALGLGLVALVVVSDRRAPPIEPGDAIAVMYFENLTDPGDSDRLARMLTQLLTSELSATPELHVTSQQRLHDVARRVRSGEATVDGVVASEVAEAAGIRTMIVGQVAELGARILASVELVDVESGRSLASSRAQASNVEDVFLLTTSLGEQIRAELAKEAGPSDGTRPRAIEPTDSVEAYRRYVAGETELSYGELDAAVEEFQEAVRIDPEFAVAQFRLSVAARWLSDAPLAHQAARRAAAIADRAPAHLRDVIRANALYQDGAFSQAIPLLEATLEHDPDQKVALYTLGQIYMHSLRDGNPARASELLLHLLELDPDFHQVYDRVVLSDALRGDFVAARARLSDWDAKFPEEVEGLRSILATFEGQPEEALGFGQTFSWIEGPLFQATAAMMASRWDIALRLVDQDVEAWRSDQLRAWALRNRAVLYTYVGEFDEATDYYRQAGRVSGFRTHEGPAGGVPASSLQLLAELMELSGEIGAARQEVGKALIIQPESWRGLYYAGRMALADDDPDAAEFYAEALRRLPAAAGETAARTYLTALRGEIALVAGETLQALEYFEAAVAMPLMLDWASTCSSAGAPVRDGLARTYLALGRDERAAAVLEELLVSGPERIDHPVIYARTLHRLGVLSLEGGRERAGRRLLEQLLSLWGEADWEIDIVEDARNRLSS